jgi:hypothetical protein
VPKGWLDELCGSNPVPPGECWVKSADERDRGGALATPAVLGGDALSQPRRLRRATSLSRPCIQAVNDRRTRHPGIPHPGAGRPDRRAGARPPGPSPTGPRRHHGQTGALRRGQPAASKGRFLCPSCWWETSTDSTTPRADPPPGSPTRSPGQARMPQVPNQWHRSGVEIDPGGKPWNHERNGWRIHCQSAASILLTRSAVLPPSPTCCPRDPRRRGCCTNRERSDRGIAACMLLELVCRGRAA